MTFGEKAVGLSFNPSGDDAVAQCKKEFAVVIDRMNDLRVKAMIASNVPSAFSHEVARMAEIAIVNAQTAQMWAVKALTWKD
jgi:hypothetical protein